MTKTCRAIVCDRAIYAGGLCNGHYIRARKNGGDPGTTPIKDRSDKPGSCRFDGCGRAPHARGLCTAHSRQESAGQELKPLRNWNSRKGDVPQDGRPCSACGEAKAPEDFYRTSTAADGLSAQCKACTKLTTVTNRYRITADQYLSMLADQGGVCAICHGTSSDGRELSIDHDHTCCPDNRSCGKCVRALLCSDCNRALGQFQDSPQRLRDAAAYLERFI